MNQAEPVRILFVEDLPEDAEMAQHEIAKENINFIFRLVDNEPDFENHLKEFVPDIIISDYSMPLFDGMSALSIVRNNNSDIPFIILTGSTNEETAVKCMKAGANDYVIKEQIKRLPFAVKEAIENGRAKKEKIKSQNQVNLMVLEYRDLINAMKETLWILSPDGVLLDVNDTAAEVLGFTRSELLEMGLSGIDKHLTHDKLLEIINETLNSKSRLFHTFHTSKNGNNIPVEVNSSPIRYHENSAILIVARDITERVKTEAKLKLLSRSVEDSPVGVVITNKKGYIEYVNSAFNNITGYSQEEAVGKTPRIFKSNQYPSSFFREVWDVITSGKNWHGEIINKKKNGVLFWAEVSISPIFSSHGEITHFVSIHEDISGKKKMIDELIKEKEKAEESERLKSAFLANMSHEIRTPMNGILGFTNLLRESNNSLAENEEYFQIIQKSGERLLNTVEDIIEISRIETNQITLSIETINISDHLKTLTRFFEPEYKKKNLVLYIEDNLQEQEKIIYTDITKLDSVITNLLKNAIKFTSKGHISISLNKIDDLLAIAVKDTGIGIPDDKLEVIFDRFIQADMGLTRSYEGTGLGLSIAKSYTNLLKGSLSVKSELGKGSIFYFSLPCYHNSQQTEKYRKAPLNGESDIPKNLKILIVEDDHPASILLKMMLKNKCEELFFAKNGIEAISSMVENPDINLILMDLKMPGMDGYEASRKIKQLNTNIKIIAQTAFALKGDKEKAIAAGCDEYITKPIIKKQLFSLINKCIS